MMIKHPSRTDGLWPIGFEAEIEIARVKAVAIAAESGSTIV